MLDPRRPPEALSLSLVGMPGCGKSTVGRHLARQLGLRFVDCDTEIERRIGVPIRDFFSQQGEAAFRDMEQEVIDGLSRQPGTVLATGGGAVPRPSSRDALHLRTHSFYLRTTPENLNRRMPTMRIACCCRAARTRRRPHRSPWLLATPGTAAAATR